VRRQSLGAELAARRIAWTARFTRSHKNLKKAKQAKAQNRQDKGDSLGPPPKIVAVHRATPCPYPLLCRLLRAMYSPSRSWSTPGCARSDLMASLLRRMWSLGERARERGPRHSVPVGHGRGEALEGPAHDHRAHVRRGLPLADGRIDLIVYGAWLNQQEEHKKADGA